MLADNTGQQTITDNNECESIVIGSLFERPADESRGVVDSVAVVQPRQPLSQVGAIAVDERAEVFGIVFRNLPKHDALIDAQFQGQKITLNPN